MEPGSPESVAFTAATDAVMWGAAVAICQNNPQPPGVDVPAAFAVPPQAILVATIDVLSHVLSFTAFKDAFDAQAAIFDRAESVQNVMMTNPNDKEVLALVERSRVGGARDGRRKWPRRRARLGPAVVVVRAPASAAAALMAVAADHGGTYQFYVPA
jgi:hypothetical protein